MTRFAGSRFTVLRSLFAVVADAGQATKFTVNRTANCEP